MSLSDNNGRDILVADLPKPIKIDIATGLTEQDASLVVPFLTDNAELYFHQIVTDWNNSQALTIVLSPETNNNTLEVYSILTNKKYVDYLKSKERPT